jgi:hypothetical protein
MVVIKYISQGEKRYIGDLNQSSYSGYCTKHPFADSNVTKFELAEALLLVRTSLINSPFRIVQIIDNTGKVLYDNKDTRLSYLN